MFHKSMRGSVVNSPLSIVMSTVQLLALLFLTHILKGKSSKVWWMGLRDSNLIHRDVTKTCFSHFAIVLFMFNFRITNIYIVL